MPSTLSHPCHIHIARNAQQNKLSSHIARTHFFVQTFGNGPPNAGYQRTMQSYLGNQIYMAAATRLEWRGGIPILSYEGVYHLTTHFPPC